ncbi:hypothetical protein I3842_04G054000 [Carya illinoinensis]|uniref:Uncharacterized protein n=1 Tax=Carya illinoinensis TaxID=32201 RepID=A0A922F961_CARIL|nr:hypothetical protein I3842_04G054000 [Carya illinoinensis]KAG6716533.1 hypothetical protein I3842_04G054000 [Carya illinoinensis]KAG6716534.1 hypothetical protein I3842_04G054000 [Carya illinoinensis]
MQSTLTGRLRVWTTITSCQGLCIVKCCIPRWRSGVRNLLKERSSLNLSHGVNHEAAHDFDIYKDLEDLGNTASLSKNGYSFYNGQQASFPVHICIDMNDLELRLDAFPSFPRKHSVGKITVQKRVVILIQFSSMKFVKVQLVMYRDCIPSFGLL